MSLVAELKRRNVFRAAAAYVAVAWLVIQVAETTFPAFGFSDAALRALILVLAAGFPPAVALSWVFELTPEGFKRDRDIAPGSELSLRTKRMLDRGIVAVLALGIAYFAFDKFVLDPARDELLVQEARQEGRTEALVESYGEKSIAVLPFANMSADPEQEFFGDGMAEEVLNLLAQIPELRVISRSSAFTFKGKDKKLTEIAEELNVVHILEGSVRRSGNKIRVTAQLIEARSDSHLWSATWDRELEDIFAIQDEIAEEVVANLKIRLLGEVPRARRVDPEAYLLFMQARQILDGFQHEQYEQVHDLMFEAARRDPGYAEPWTGLAWLYYRCHLYRDRDGGAYCASKTAEEWLALSEQARARALEIDPDNPTANAYAGFSVAFGSDRDLQAAADRYRRAIEAAPPVTDVVRAAGIFARLIQRPELAIRLGEYGVPRDPLCQQCLYHLGLAYLDAGRYSDAERIFEKFVLLGRGGWISLGTARLLSGDAPGALEAFDHQSAPDQLADARANAEHLASRARALYSLGRKAEFAETLAALESRVGEQAAVALAEVYAWAGDVEAASAWLGRSRERPTPTGAMLPFNHLSPFLGPVLALPRWQEYLRQFGLADDQLAAIEFEFTLPGE